MYAIYGNIYHQYTPNVSIYIYTIHGSYGYMWYDKMYYVVIFHNISLSNWRFIIALCPHLWPVAISVAIRHGLAPQLKGWYSIARVALETSELSTKCQITFLEKWWSSKIIQIISQ